MNPLALLDGSTPREILARRGGGKARQLAAMEALGLTVPPWFCLPVEALDLALDGAVEPDCGRASAAAPEVPPAVAEAIRRELDARGLTTRFLAVRSSGLEEDGAERSYAGQFESVLHCRGHAQVLAAVRRCWRSAFSDRVQAYRQALGDGTHPIRMGVIVQEMVDAEVAGVAFSRDPLRPLERDHVIIESVWGLGEGLVSGEMPADRHTVHRVSGDVVTEVVEKERARVRAPGGGTRDVPLPDPDRTRSSLTAEQAAEVARTAVRLEEALGSPQDVEWAFQGGRLSLLQTRPVTTLPPQALFDPGVTGDEPVIWDNSNIIESYSGVTTPLTFSHVSRSYREVYRVTCRAAGVPEAIVARHEPMFRNMLGLVRGRIYYNLANWYRLLSLFPLLGRSGRFMETMMGVRASLPEELADRVDPTATAPRYGLGRRLALLARLARTVAGGDRERARFLRRMDAVCGPLEEADLASMSLPDLLKAHQLLEERILKHWTAPINNDTRCMISFGLLGLLTRRWITRDPDDAAALQNDLLCGQGDLTSAEPTRLLLAIARDVDREGGELRRRILEGDPQEVWAELEEEAPDLRHRFDAYLRRFGFRCVDELKLETLDFHDRPWLLVTTVAGYLRHGVPSSREMAERERSVREGAESRVTAALSRPRRFVFNVVLGWTRRAVADRERLRFERTRAFGVMRRIFRGMGRNLVALGRLEDPEDVFYLTVEELLAFGEGRSVALDLHSLADVRKREYQEYRTTPAPPDRFLTRGAVGASLSYPDLLAARDLAAPEELDDHPDLLRGTPCCAGVVEAVVRVAHSFEDCAGSHGEILVTQRTDPGWIPVFPGLAGLLVERGGLLSHSAVVAREMGIPTIVGLGGRPMERLRTGDRVRMDGGRGTVEVLP
ncbi:MAG: PEP/pyruvate-binding domain-containing protein [Gemmatimonadota bacterium]